MRSRGAKLLVGVQEAESPKLLCFSQNQHSEAPILFLRIFFNHPSIYVFSVVCDFFPGSGAPALPDFEVLFKNKGLPHSAHCSPKRDPTNSGGMASRGGMGRICRPSPVGGSALIWREGEWQMRAEPPPPLEALPSFATPPPVRRKNGQNQLGPIFGKFSDFAPLESHFAPPQKKKIWCRHCRLIMSIRPVHFLLWSTFHLYQPWLWGISIKLSG